MKGKLHKAKRKRKIRNTWVVVYVWNEPECSNREDPAVVCARERKKERKNRKSERET